LSVINSTNYTSHLEDKLWRTRSELRSRRCAKRWFKRNKSDILERKRLELRCFQI